MSTLYENINFGQRGPQWLTPVHGLSGGLGLSWVGLLRVWRLQQCNSAATLTAGPRPSKHLRPVVVLSHGATNMMIRCARISASVDYCSLSVQLRRQRPSLKNASQCYIPVSGRFLRRAS